MATVTTMYAKGRANLIKKAIDWASADIRVALLSSSYTPDFTSGVGGDETWGDVSAFEVSGTGYTAGGKALTNKTVTLADNSVEYSSDDVTWTNITVTPKYAVFKLVEGGSPASTDPLIFGMDLDSTQAAIVASNSDLTVQKHPDGFWFNIAGTSITYPIDMSLSVSWPLIDTGMTVPRIFRSFAKKDDESLIVAVGDFGTILTSTDLGLTWTDVSNKSITFDAFLQVVYIEANSTWLMHTGDQIYISTDDFATSITAGPTKVSGSELFASILVHSTGKCTVVGANSSSGGDSHYFSLDTPYSTLGDTSTIITDTTTLHTNLHGYQTSTGAGVLSAICSTNSTTYLKMIKSLFSSNTPHSVTVKESSATTEQPVLNMFGVTEKDLLVFMSKGGYVAKGYIKNHETGSTTLETPVTVGQTWDLYDGGYLPKLGIFFFVSLSGVVFSSDDLATFSTAADILNADACLTLNGRIVLTNDLTNAGNIRRLEG